MKNNFEDIMSNKWTKDDFNKIYLKSDPWFFRTSKYELKKYEHQNIIIKDNISEVKTILEIGCAEGTHTNLLQNDFPKANIDAVDISTTAIERARKGLINKRVSFYSDDIVTFLKSVENKKYDVIVASEMIYYLGDRLNRIDFSNFISRMLSTLNFEGIICMANIIDLVGGIESNITKKEKMNIYFDEISSKIKPVLRKEIIDYKEEDRQYHHYEIWLFKKLGF